MTELPEAGGWQPTLIEVGTLPMTPDLLAPEGELEGMVDVPSNVLLLRGHGMTVLVDAGSGPHVDLWEGATENLEGSLAAAGCRFEDVDLLVMTHLDFDHAGGCCEFPRARMAVPAGAVPVDDPADPGRIAVEHFRTGEQLDWIEDGGSPAPNLVVRSAPGHRAGHSIVEIGSTPWGVEDSTIVEVPDGLWHIADVVHHPLQVTHLDWDHVFDSDPRRAWRTRRKTLMYAWGANVTVVGSHIAGPGRIARTEGERLSFRWEPL